MQSRWWRFLSYRIRVEVKVQDAWIGFFWDRKADGWHAWLCLLPCLPLHFWRPRPNVGPLRS